MDFWDIPSLIRQHGSHQAPVKMWKLLAQLVQIIICKSPKNVREHFAAKQRMTEYAKCSEMMPHSSDPAEGSNLAAGCMGTDDDSGSRKVSNLAYVCTADMHLQIVDRRITLRIMSRECYPMLFR